MSVADLVAIEEAHLAACSKKELFYQDPSTQLYVFTGNMSTTVHPDTPPSPHHHRWIHRTEHAHRERGVCCGSGCRHCPYDHVNVKKPADVDSGPIHEEDDSESESESEGEGEGEGEGESGGEGVAHEVQAGVGSDREDAASNREQVASDAVEREAKDVMTKGSCEQQQSSSGFRSVDGKNLVFTKSGDSGMSDLFTGERRRKDDALFEALGALDELQAFVASARYECEVTCCPEPLSTLKGLHGLTVLLTFHLLRPEHILRVIHCTCEF